MHRRFALVTLLLLSLVAGPAATPAVADAGASPVASDAPHVQSASEPLAADVATGQAASDSAPDDPSPVASLPADGAEGAEASELTRTLSLRLTPGTPGELEAEVRFDVPDEVTDVTLTIQSNADVTDTTNFERTGEQQYEWNGTGDTASVTFTYAVNETRDTGRRAGTAAQADAVEPYSFVDTGDWALARVARLGTSWRWVGTGDVVLDERVEVEGEGTTGGYMAYLGPMETYTRTVRNQEIRLVVPEAATLRESPAAILDSVGNASEQLRLGERDERVMLVAAPTTLDWSSAGLQYGDTDAWVVANARLDTANNVWVHEYVHTRQEFTANSSSRWLVEGSADYYAALFTYQQGRIGFEAFQEKLGRGLSDPQATAVMSDPTTWSNQANYLKGALVAGAIDREVRADTDGGASLQTVIRRFNDDGTTIDNADVLSAVESVASTNASAYAEQYTTSSSVPSTWSRSTHTDLFGPIPAAFDYEIPADGVGVTGEYRNGSIGRWQASSDDGPIQLAVGERLEVTVAVENIGGTDGEYDASFKVDGTVENWTSGTLTPSERTTLSFAHRFDDPGNYTVTVGDRELAVQVQEPADPRVTGLDAPAEVAVGEPFTVETAVDNEAAWPAAGEVVMSLDGETMLTENVRLPPRSRLTYTGRVTVAEPGVHTIQVGNRSVTVEAVDPDAGSEQQVDRSDGTGRTGGSGPVPVPGFGAATALLALALALGVLGGGVLVRR
ncbi:CARDB domain-containing protein [Haloarchaeobius sp. HRN-SO-5]|uniref:CARDB domain-containing protein n=1 Tax=Haloarchaeobius sp. HRN-SO-5 TaxID=3446118 RepID=UPI003EC12C3C